ncbi:MAG TPA: hypothetical protein PK080_17645, partial [Hyphomonadaceae bacterium]|nr:hypothetical protein [Hyphomonadaceae bacterium]
AFLVETLHHRLADAARPACDDDDFIGDFHEDAPRFQLVESTMPETARGSSAEAKWCTISLRFLTIVASGTKCRWEKSACLRADMIDFSRPAHALPRWRSLIHLVEIRVHDS